MGMLYSVLKSMAVAQWMGVALHIYIYCSQLLACVPACFICENKVRLQRELFVIFFAYFLCYYYLIHNSSKTFVRAGIYEVNNTSAQPAPGRHIVVVLFMEVREKYQTLLSLNNMFTSL